MHPAGYRLALDAAEREGSSDELGVLVTRHVRELLEIGANPR
jgi:hypothetical protein